MRVLLTTMEPEIIAEALGKTEVLCIDVAMEPTMTLIRQAKGLGLDRYCLVGELVDHSKYDLVLPAQKAKAPAKKKADKQATTKVESDESTQE